ncbi:MAG: hypothetical protein ABJA78_01535 [Ferruginibacter sp.]
MKTILMLSGFVILTLASSAQSNNPYDQRGIDYVSSLKIITDDYKSGKATSFSQESLDYYSKTIPLHTTVNTDLVAAVVKTVKGSRFNLVDLINNSSASDFVKNKLLELYHNSQSLKSKEFQDYLVSAVENVKGTRAADTDKEIVLTNMSIAYNSARSNQCEINGIPADSGDCAIVGALGGFVVGLGICGFWCGVGGAVIGAVVFGLC